jgi:hypothetical protein
VFTGSFLQSGSININGDITSTGTITAQTLVVQVITSSTEFVTGSTRFGSLLSNTHLFTGSVSITGSLEINGVDYNATSASFDTRITTNSSSISLLSGSFLNASASFDTRITTNSASIALLSGSYLADSASFDNRITVNSASISTLSGSFLTASGSFDTRITTNSASIATLSSSFLAFSASYNTGSFTGSFTGSVLGNLTGTSSFATSASYAFNATSASYAFDATTSSYAVNADLLDGRDSSTFASTGSNYFSGSQTISGSLQLLPTSDPDLSGTNLTDTFLFQSASNTALGYDLYFRQNGNLVKWKWMEGMLETGLLYGGIVTFSGSFVFVSSGSGIIVNHNANTSSEISPIVDYVQWDPITASITNITSSQVTYLYIDDNGALQQQSIPFTPQQYHEYIPLGAVGHFNQQSISAFGSAVRTAYDQGSQVGTFIDAFGPLKVNGYQLNGQTGSLSLSVGSGTTFAHGGFYEFDPEFPSIFSSPSAPTASIVRCFISGSKTVFDTNNGSLYTTINPGFVNNIITGVTSSLSNNNWTIQRVFSFAPTNTLYVYYGQSAYTTFAEALSEISADPFIEGETKPFTTFVGYLVVKSNATSINNIDSRVVEAGLFRSSGAGSGGGSISAANLDDLNDVSIITPVTGEALIYNAGIWSNGYPTSASYAANSTSASYANSSSFTVFAQTASHAEYAISASYASASTSASYALDATTASYAVSALTSSHALTASSADDLVVRGTLTAQQIIVQVITSSVSVVTGSFIVSGSLEALSGITGSLLGTASWAENAISSSYALSATSSSYALSSTSASHANSAISSSYALTASFASNVPATSSFAISASQAESASYALTASFALNIPATASYSLEALSASFAAFAISSSFATTASFALNGGGGGGAQTFAQTTASLTWSFNHNLNTFTPLVQVYDSSYNSIIPDSIVGITADDIQITFVAPQTGFAIISTGGSITVTGSNAQLNQTAAATTWSFYHNLNTTYPVFTIFDENNDVIIPQRINVENANTASIYFTTARTGTAVAANCGLSGSTFESASYATFAETSTSASFATNTISASYALNSTNAVSASWITGSNVVGTVASATSASFATTAVTASYLNPIVNSYIILSQVSQSLDFADDAAAAAGGVPLGGLYRNGNFILIRIS